MTKLDRQTLDRLQAGLREIDAINATVTRMGERIDRAAREYGDAVRAAVGRNLLSQFTNEELGEIVFCAIVNALLDRAEAIRAEIGDQVAVPGPPCPRQAPTSLGAE